MTNKKEAFDLTFPFVLFATIMGFWYSNLSIWLGVAVGMVLGSITICLCDISTYYQKLNNEQN